MARAGSFREIFTVGSVVNCRLVSAGDLAAKVTYVGGDYVILMDNAGAELAVPFHSILTVKNPPQ
jgi:hypothetical protein